jgi:hypothetical protein
MTRAVVGIACYSRPTWAELRATGPDANELEATYEAWLEVFYLRFAQVRAAGVQPARVEVDLDAVMA